METLTAPSARYATRSPCRGTDACQSSIRMRPDSDCSTASPRGSGRVGAGNPPPVSFHEFRTARLVDTFCRRELRPTIRYVIGRKRRRIIPRRSPAGATLRQCNRATASDQQYRHDSHTTGTGCEGTNGHERARQSLRRTLQVANSLTAGRLRVTVTSVSDPRNASSASAARLPRLGCRSDCSRSSAASSRRSSWGSRGSSRGT